MIIEVNKDIDRYKESVCLGLTARQLIFSIEPSENNPIAKSSCLKYFSFSYLLPFLLPQSALSPVHPPSICRPVACS